MSAGNADSSAIKDKDWSSIWELLGVGKRTAREMNKENPEAKKRYAAYRNDIAGFLRYYFPEYITLDPPGFQRAVFDILERPSKDIHGRWRWQVSKEQTERLRSFHRAEFRHIPQEVDVLRGLAFCAPRETGKSTVFARLVLIWMVIYDYVKFFVYIRANAELAETFLRDTMDEFVHNERLVADFGNLRGATWSRGLYSLKNGAVCIAIGRGENVRGLVHKNLRPDLIVMDDITNDFDKNSPKILDTLYNWIVSAIFNLSKDALILYLNTIFNDLDPMYLLQERIVAGTLPRWLGCRMSAEIDDSTALWPEFWPMEELAIKRREVGSAVYDLEYMSIVESGKGKVLPKEIFQSLPMAEIDLSGLDVRFGVDPNAEGHDDAAICVTGRPWGMERYYTIDCWEKDAASISDLVDAMVRLHRKWRPSAIAFESNGFQNVYRKILVELLADNGIALPLVGVEAKGSKVARATGIQALFENGLWQIEESLLDSNFFHKVYRFPLRGLADGPVDALELSHAAFAGCGQALGRAPKRTSALPGLIRRYRDGLF